MSHERRRDPRRRTSDISVRMRPGHRLLVIDVSARGALVEAGRPLRPGSQVELQMETADRQGRLAARVVRCTVAAIHPESGVTYQAGLSFNDECEWICEVPTQPGYSVPAPVGSVADVANCHENRLPADPGEVTRASSRGAK